MGRFARGAAGTSLLLASVILMSSAIALLVGYSIGTAKAAIGATSLIAPIDPTCSSSSPCIEYDNIGSGPGIRGISSGGNGLAGSTKVNSTSQSNAREGLIGNDISTSGGFNAGVRGLSVRGTGVAGQSTSGNGVNGTSSSLSGVFGSSSSGVGVFGFSTSVSGVIGSTGGTGLFDAGVEGINTATTPAILANGNGGPLFIGNNSSATDVFVVDDGGNATIGGNTSVGGSATLGGDLTARFIGAGGAIPSLGVGVEGRGANAGIEGISSACCGPAVVAVGSGGNIFLGVNSASTATFLALDNGNLQIAGSIFTAGTCSSGCVKDPAAPGPRVITYAPQEAVPTTEDVGQAQLVSGQAYVALDPAFANVIDQRANYLVFITPEGDSRGLYVTQKSLAGFAVRENQGGHATLAFSYRIVAKPFGKSAPRLARIVLAPQPRATLRPQRMAPLTRTPKPRLRGI
jgi:hypothetical protein